LNNQNLVSTGQGRKKRRGLKVKEPVSDTSCSGIAEHTADLVRDAGVMRKGQWEVSKSLG
jgi:hypothetical protein